MKEATRRNFSSAGAAKEVAVRVRTILIGGWRSVYYFVMIVSWAACLRYEHGILFPEARRGLFIDDGTSYLAEEHSQALHMTTGSRVNGGATPTFHSDSLFHHLALTC